MTVIAEKFLPREEGYGIGDILYGMFPVRDGRGVAPHFALAFARVGETPLVRAIVGTSQHLPPHDGRDRYGLVVLWGADDPANWPALGILKPTQFDFVRGQEIVLGKPMPGQSPRYAEQRKAGSLRGSEFWSLMLDRAARRRR